MHDRRIWLMALVLLLLLASPSLFSQSLDDLVSQALGESVQMRNLEITKNNALLEKGISEAEEKVGITVSSGDVSATYDPANSSYVFSTTGVEASFVLPNDGDTTLTVSTGTVRYRPSGTDFAISPELSVDHTFTYGYTGDNRKSLVNRQTEVLANSTYESNKLNFTNTMYTQISNLMGNEQSIKQTEKEIADLQRELQQNLSLKMLKEGSLTYEAQKQAIASQEATLASLKASRELLLRQYVTLTGFPWQGVDSIPEPVLDFTNKTDGNSSVLLKSLDLSLAKEDLALKMAELENKTLNLAGSLGASSIDSAFNPNGSTAVRSINPEVSATLKAKQFSVTGKVSGTYDFTADSFSPTVSVGGTWSNNTTSVTDSLEVQQLQNDVLLAELAYANAKDEFQQSVIALENTIAKWNLDYTLLGQEIDYHTNVLQQQQDLFARGLASQSQVDDAAFTVEMDAYNLAITLLEGLQLENEIRILQI